MTTEENYIKKIGRVLYLDPNDVFGNINGVPMTPDYSDMSISFKLECQIVPRFKKNMAIAETNVSRTDNNSKEQTTTKYQLNWNTPYGKIGEFGNWVSFLQGELYNGGNDNSLTTYYTDINYDDYAKRTIVEGLGVESINVAYENYYSPTITIKFVDHRGSSLFGREEVTHYDDKITIDSVFGAFFTAPYPKFRLQIKGFYGRAVTYQMTCSGFKGSLNSQTGNFEAVATFIGYSYSLLTDIPFEYLVAAPYCEYFGKDYWEEHKGSEEWRMDESYEGDDVPTFYELAQRIEAAFNNAELLDVLTPEDKKTVDSSNIQLSMLENILSIYEDLFNIVADNLCGNIDPLSFTSTRKIIVDTDSQQNEEGTESSGGNRLASLQVLYVVKWEVTEVWETTQQTFKLLQNTINEYNKAFEDNPILIEGGGCLPTIPQGILKSEPFFEKSPTTGKLVIIGTDNNVETISKKKINDITIDESLAENILEFTSRAVNADVFEGMNAYLINWGYLQEMVMDEISDIKTRIKGINDQKERNYIHLAINHLGIVPYIGNIFKLIMCHIETFVYMMLQCYLNIDSAARVNERTADFLKVPVDCTDVAPSNRRYNIPPWPLINKSNDTTNYYLMYEKDDTYGWVGDFSPYFEEAKLVRALYLACKRTAKDPKKDDATQPVNIIYIPITPNDLNNNLNPFAGGGKDISSMAGMLGLRAAQIFGIGEGTKIDDELAKLMGKIDALNYHRFFMDKEELGVLLEQHKGKLSDILYDIMLCKPSADQTGTTDENNSVVSHAFEFAKGMFPQVLTAQMKDRHPIYVEGNGVLYYTYLHTKSHYGLIPSNTVSWDKYKTTFAMVGDETNGTYFNYKLVNVKERLVGNSFLHRSSSTQLFSDYIVPEEKSRYLNNEMYCVVNDQSLVAGIIKRYEEMKTGSVSVLGEKFELDMSKILNRYWNLEKKYSYQENSRVFFTVPLKDAGVEDKNLLIGNGPDESTNIHTIASILEGDLFDEKYCVRFKESKVFLNDQETDLNNTIVGTQHNISDESYGGYSTSIFATPFYYLQNQIADEITRNKVKALLFLHTLPYNNMGMLWDGFCGNESSVDLRISRIPLGCAAFYGGILWRHEYIKKNGVDPIQYKDNGGVSYTSAYENGKTEYCLYFMQNNGKIATNIKTSGNYSFSIFKENNIKYYLFEHQPEYFVTNELIRVFEDFVSKQWTIISQLELKLANGKTFANGTELKEHIKSLRTAMEAVKTQTQQEVNAEQVEAGVATGDTASTEQTQQKSMVSALKDAANTFANFTKYYCFLYYYWSTSEQLYLFSNPNNKEMQDTLRSVYMDECIELRSGPYSFSLNDDSKIGTYTDIAVNITNLKSYLSGFAEQLDVIVKNDNPNFVNERESLVIEETPEFNRDIALPIYMYLKMLWDKWLVGMDLNNHEFMLKNFNENFIFIDSFYRNIAHRFMINCQTLLECYNNVSANEDITTFKFITDVVNKHNLMFVGMPDFVSGMVNYGLGGEIKAVNSMKTIFTPLPYEQMNPIDNKNKFVTVYIPRLSEIPSELNGYKNDSFDIISEGNKLERTETKILDILSDDYGFEDTSMYGLYSDYAYYVPSFGLSYGRQNNHIFKNINLTMETPIITSTVINTLSHIARKGANNTHRIAYVGQDLYPVFSNYSYICEFEMMGCAQIQPLMYFQLMNVPMWRGTYIIFSVNHVMTPGNMVTKVKAMKLSNRAIPYSNVWFTENPNFDPEALRRLECIDLLSQGKLMGGYNVTTNTTNATTPSGNNTPTSYGSGIFTGKTSKEQRAICEVTNITRAGQAETMGLIVKGEYKGGVGGSKTYDLRINKHVLEDIQAIANEVANLGWFDFKITSAYRAHNSISNGLSNHCKGIAVDINSGAGGNPSYNPWFNKSFGKNDPEPEPGHKFSCGINAYSQPKNGYDRTKCIWHYEHPVAQIFRSHGWHWGGSFGDVMHFDLRGQDT